MICMVPCVVRLATGVDLSGLELYHRQRSVRLLSTIYPGLFSRCNILQPADRLAPPPVHGVVFALHVTLSILAYAAFALSFVLSLIFLGEERHLRITNSGMWCGGFRRSNYSIR